MSLHFELAHAAGEGPQLPTTPLQMLPPPNAPSVRRAIIDKSRDRHVKRRRLDKDRWLVTSDGALVGRVKRIVRRLGNDRRVFMVHGPCKDVVDFRDDRGICAETGEEVTVQRLMM